MNLNPLSLPILSDLENLFIRRNLQHTQPEWDFPEGKKILYIIKRTEVCGGVETRLLQYARELAKHHCNVLFVTDKNKFPALKKFRCLHLNFHAGNFESILIDLIKRYRIDIAELHIKGKRNLHLLDARRIKEHCRFGCCVHSNIPSLDPERLNEMDYCIFISDRLNQIDYSRLKSYHVLPIAITGQTPCWKWNGQRRALLISRIRYDKCKQIESFVEYCKTKDIPFHIAGATGNSRIARKLIKRLSLQPEHFIGRIDNTPEFLTAHADEYLFVAGVGQVILEAGSLGYPCFLCSDLGPAYSTFVTRQNIAQGFFRRNFTLAFRPKDNLFRPVTDFLPEEAGNYDLSAFMYEHYNIDNRFKQYKENILEMPAPASGESHKG